MWTRMIFRRSALPLLVVCIIIFLFWSETLPMPKWNPDWRSSKDELPSDNVREPEQEDILFVVASQIQDNTTWLAHAFPTWEKAIFVTDGDTPSRLSVPANKGRESMVYLTYIIDNYDHLPDIAIFHHANRYQWHNDDPLYDGLRLLNRLRIPYIKDEGYVNLRCVWTLGCPAEIRPNDEADSVTADGKRGAGTFYRQAFQEIFPGLPVPEIVGSKCCAQFAVTRAKIQERPRSDYEAFRRWLLETDLEDDISGRILEYSWHMIFGKEAVSCPNAKDCYCKTYGICNLDCESDGICRDQYTLPAFSTLPEGWPDYDWDGNWRNVTQLRDEQERSWDSEPLL